MFVTLYYVGLEPGSRMLTGINAGHNPPLQMRRSDQSLFQLPQGGLPLGLEEAGTFSAVSVDVSPGDILLMYTDGVVDAQSERGEFYGLQRLIDAIVKNGDRSAMQMVEAIGADVAGFAAGKPPFDDLTMVAVKYVG
jgi:sigma-B regulation protein RsbU (phosphoserine phosphatase)